MTVARNGIDDRPFQSCLASAAARSRHWSASPLAGPPVSASRTTGAAEAEDTGCATAAGSGWDGTGAKGSGTSGEASNVFNCSAVVVAFDEGFGGAGVSSTFGNPSSSGGTIPCCAGEGSGVASGTNASGGGAVLAAPGTGGCSGSGSLGATGGAGSSAARGTNAGAFRGWRGAGGGGGTRRSGSCGFIAGDMTGNTLCDGGTGAGDDDADGESAATIGADGTSGLGSSGAGGDAGKSPAIGANAGAFRGAGGAGAAGGGITGGVSVASNPSGNPGVDGGVDGAGGCASGNRTRRGDAGARRLGGIGANISTNAGVKAGAGLGAGGAGSETRGRRTRAGASGAWSFFHAAFSTTDALRFETGADGTGATINGREEEAVADLDGRPSSGCSGVDDGDGMTTSSGGTVDSGGMTTYLEQEGQAISIPMPASSTTRRWSQWMHLKKISMRQKPVLDYRRQPGVVNPRQPCPDVRENTGWSASILRQDSPWVPSPAIGVHD